MRERQGDPRGLQQESGRVGVVPSRSAAGTRVVHAVIDVVVGIDAAHAVSSVYIPFAELPYRPSSRCFVNA